MQHQTWKITWRIAPWAWILVSLLVQPCLGSEDPSRYPSKPITMVVQYGAGGINDLTGRKLAELAGKTLGEPIVVVNKVGGGAVLGTTAIAHAEPDGYIIGLVSRSAFAIVPHLRSVPFKTKEDFTWIMQFGESCEIFCVRADARWKTFKQLIEEARNNPGKLNYASASPLSGQHILMEYVFSQEKVRLNHVPVSGGAEVITKLLGGHIDAGISTDMGPHVKSGKFRGLAVQGKKLTQFPDIPTLMELGYHAEAFHWLGINAPKGLDPRIQKKLYEAFKKAYDDVSFKELLATLFITPIFRDSESFKAIVFQDYDAQGAILRGLGFLKQ
ncbi:MAG TPA: tripartite tricarboxylate transporter substrate binding protein [Thermodesulfobacteriota bacterium]|nr:tripartite tricarboxylate transporter substrate binding protein [Thermodesulfobacteriota bacterium]